MSLHTIRELFPDNGRIILTGDGKQFIEKIGIDAVKQVVLGVLQGENIRTQTEPLTRRRVTQATGAMIALCVHGWDNVENFTDNISQMALTQIRNSRRNDNANVWPAQWLLGLTGKSVQNVLRSSSDARDAYITDFEAAIDDAALQCERDYGRLSMNLGFVEMKNGTSQELGWKDITRLTTAIGCATLAIRGSDKSMYGKLFERLVLGTVLTILDFDRVQGTSNSKIEKVFWLSDSADVRECDATIRLRAGKLARFDIGFIGIGNPEIVKDKLTRYASEIEVFGVRHTSQTFVIIDRMPKTQKTKEAADRSGTAIIQMSMQYWPRELARLMETKLGYKHELAEMEDDKIGNYLKDKITSIPIQDFLVGVNLRDIYIDSGSITAREERELYGEEEGLFDDE